MPTVYKNPSDQRTLRQWCSETLMRAEFPLTNATLDTSVGRVELTYAGTGQLRIVMVPGTGFTAAVVLPRPQAVSVHQANTVLDLPG